MSKIKCCKQRRKAHVDGPKGIEWIGSTKTNRADIRQDNDMTPWFIIHQGKTE